MLYKIAGFSRQGFFKQSKRVQINIDLDKSIMDKVVKVRVRHKRMGSRQIHYTAAITEIGITKFEQWMSRQNMTVPIRKRRIITTQSGTDPKLPNLINGLELNDINQVIAGDITYYQVREKLYYIFTLKDMYSKRIVGLYGNDNMKAENALKALNQMLKLRAKENVTSMIHHTDGGGQYKALKYIASLEKSKILRSMAGNCLENGLAEQLNGVLKNDYFLKKGYTEIYYYLIHQMDHIPESFLFHNKLLVSEKLYLFFGQSFYPILTGKPIFNDSMTAKHAFVT